MKIYLAPYRAQIWYLGVFGDADSESVFRFGLSGQEVGQLVVNNFGQFGLGF